MDRIKLISAALFIISVVPVFSQEKEDDKLNQNVVVVREFEPTISDAFKISELPRIIDTVKVAPDFKYFIQTSPINTDFELESIKPAKIVGEPLTRLYHGYAKAGFGNYVTPFGELYLTNLRSKSWQYGLLANHISSSGKVRNAIDQKVDAGYSNTNATIFGNKYLKHHTITGDAGFNRDVVHFYGYNTEDFDTVFENDAIRQRFISLEGKLGVRTNYNDSTHLNYSILSRYKFYNDLAGYTENRGGLNASLNYFYDKEQIGLDIKSDYYNSALLDTVNNTIVVVNPWICMYGERWRVVAGLSMETDIIGQDAFYHWYPKATLQYDIYENIVVPYAGIDGYVEKNSYASITNKNPFIVPGMSVESTNNKFIVLAGLKGHLSQSMNYNLGGSYSQIKDLYMFVNDTANPVMNQFRVIYDDAELYKATGEISYRNGEKIEASLHGNYYAYNMLNEDMAWHKPGFDVTLSAKYNLRNKIIAGMDVFVIGNRYAKDYYNASGNRKLNNIYDINLKLEYRYNKNLSAFARFNNMAGMRYDRWNYYPAQRFNFLIGLTYSFLGEKVSN